MKIVAVVDIHSPVFIKKGTEVEVTSELGESLVKSKLAVDSANVPPLEEFKGRRVKDQDKAVDVKLMEDKLKDKS